MKRLEKERDGAKGGDDRKRLEGEVKKARGRGRKIPQAAGPL